MAALFLQNLHPGFVAMDQVLTLQLFPQAVIDPFKVQFARVDHPVAQRTAADADVGALQRL